MSQLNINPALIAAIQASLVPEDIKRATNIGLAGLQTGAQLGARGLDAFRAGIQQIGQNMIAAASQAAQLRLAARQQQINKRLAQRQLFQQTIESLARNRLRKRELDIKEKDVESLIKTRKEQLGIEKEKLAVEKLLKTGELDILAKRLDIDKTRLTAALAELEIANRRLGVEERRQSVEERGQQLRERKFSIIEKLFPNVEQLSGSSGGSEQPTSSSGGGGGSSALDLSKEDRAALGISAMLGIPLDQARRLFQGQDLVKAQAEVAKALNDVISGKVSPEQSDVLQRLSHLREVSPSVTTLLGLPGGRDQPKEVTDLQRATAKIRADILTGKLSDETRKALENAAKDPVLASLVGLDRKSPTFTERMSKGLAIFASRGVQGLDDAGLGDIKDLVVGVSRGDPREAAELSRLMVLGQNAVSFNDVGSLKFMRDNLAALVGPIAASGVEGLSSIGRQKKKELSTKLLGTALPSIAAIKDPTLRSVAIKDAISSAALVGVFWDVASLERLVDEFEREGVSVLFKKDVMSKFLIDEEKLKDIVRKKDRKPLPINIISGGIMGP